MSSYDSIRQQYRPKHIKILLVAESPPPSASSGGSRHFYRTDRLRTDDRLFANTIKALYSEAINLSEVELEQQKQQWLKKFQSDGYYLIEALETSLRHSVKKPERQARIKEHLPQLIKRLKTLTDKHTKIILIKSNVFEVAATPLRQAGFTVLNKELVDYPGQYNQRAYRDKLSALIKRVK